MLAAAKEEILSLPMVWSEDSVLLLAADLCAETRIAPTLRRGRKPHQGVAGKNPALEPGSAFANSKIALGLREAQPENRIGSRCTGKERDSESGLDNFGARYDSSSLGRFMSPDPAGLKAVHLQNPQGWNSYAYTINSPLRYTDPTGKYKCADDHNKCKSEHDIAFETARQNDLKSTDKKVAAAAKAFGDKTIDNHVSVSFVDNGKGGTKPEFHRDGNTTISVQIPSDFVGVALDAIVGHEGVHVGQGQALAASIQPDGSYDQSLNLTSY